MSANAKGVSEVHKLIQDMAALSTASTFGSHRTISFLNKGSVQFTLSAFGNSAVLSQINMPVLDKYLLETFFNDLCNKADLYNVPLRIPPNFHGVSHNALISMLNLFDFVKERESKNFVRSPLFIRAKETAGAQTELARADWPEWFKNYTDAQRDAYLDEHKNSKLAKSWKREKTQPQTDAPKKQKVEKPKHLIDILKKEGSPFKGPTDKDSSITGNWRFEQKLAVELDKIAALTEKAIAEGKDVPDYNLCEIQVPGTNLFCELNLGVPRKSMPQLKGKPSPNSWADRNLEKDKKGEVDSEEVFRKILEDKNIAVKSAKIPATKLKATQTELVGSKVAGMTKALQKDPANKGITAPIFISKDGYVLDGHHRWAAQLGLSIKAGKGQDYEIDCEIIDLTMEELLGMTNDFCERIGIKAKAGKSAEHSTTRVVARLIKVLANTIDKTAFTKLFREGEKVKIVSVEERGMHSLMHAGDFAIVSRVSSAGVDLRTQSGTVHLVAPSTGVYWQKNYDDSLNYYFRYSSTKYVSVDIRKVKVNVPVAAKYESSEGILNDFNLAIKEFEASAKRYLKGLHVEASVDLHGNIISYEVDCLADKSKAWMRDELGLRIMGSFNIQRVPDKFTISHIIRSSVNPEKTKVTPLTKVALTGKTPQELFSSINTWLKDNKTALLSYV